jgi:5-bromo-4-chloroindolyl phosphate hydrolysis protein
MIITDEHIKLETENKLVITGYDIGITLDRKQVVISYKNNNKEIIMQQKLTDKEARHMARELNNARSHLK